MWRAQFTNSEVLWRMRRSSRDESTTSRAIARVLHAEAPRRKDPHVQDALEGERKQVTVLFADLKGSMELLADRDPEEARKILDPVRELMTAR